jgi:hypothetical protein
MQSSNSIKSKILTAAMEVDGDYKTFRTKLDKRISSPIIKDNASALKKSIEIKTE